MTIFSSIILGVIEGMTEFLPISSTFHLIFVAKILNLPSSSFIKLFEVAIQSGSILALLILYFNNLKKDCLLLKKIFLSFLPTAAIGLIFYKIIKNVFFSSESLMVWVFIGVGFLFFFIEFLVKNNKIKLHKSLPSLSYLEAFLIGLIQSLAIIPGVSRAGIVMVGMMFLGFKRTEAAFYSFFLAIPTIFAASIFDLYKSKEVVFASNGNLFLLAIGFISAFFSAYFTLRWFIAFLTKNSLVWFGVYRVGLGLTLILA